MEKEESNIIIRAKIFARKYHASMGIDTVSGDWKPQIEHLQEVADLVWASGGSDIEIAAAWLHDTVEDTQATIEDIKELFGHEIAEIVDSLTDLEEIVELPTRERKARQAERVKGEGVSAKRIKIADQISNTRLVTLDPKTTWTAEDNQDYAIGAKMIADNCRGISSTLDELFDREYERAEKILKFK